MVTLHGPYGVRDTGRAIWNGHGTLGGDEIEQAARGEKAYLPRGESREETTAWKEEAHIEGR